MLENAKDFSRDDASNQATGLIFRYPFADQAIEGFFRGRRVAVTDLIINYIENGFVQTFTGPRHKNLSDRKSTRLNSSHANISYAVFCLKKKKKINTYIYINRV